MRLRNTTPFADATIREVVRFVCPVGVHGYDVRVLNAARGTLHGRAYAQGSGYHDTAAPFVRLYIGAAARFPSPPRPAHRAGYLPMPWLASPVEALVYVAAHELRHLWQAKVPKGRRVWGARGQYSERDADAYAIRLLRAWRKAH